MPKFIFVLDLIWHSRKGEIFLHFRLFRLVEKCARECFTVNYTLPLLSRNPTFRGVYIPDLGGEVIITEIEGDIVSYSQIWMKIVNHYY